MFEKQYIIDPGAHRLRIYDPKSKEIRSMRSVYVENHPDRLADDAFCAFWESSANHLVYPFSKGVVEADPTPLIAHLMKQMPTDRFFLKPGAVVLCTQQPDAGQKKKWEQLASLVGWQYIRFEHPCLHQKKDILTLSIHAGASYTHMTLCAHGKILRQKSYPVGGLKMDRNIAQWIGKKWKSMIFAEDARALRETASLAFSQGRKPTLNCTVLDQRQGFVQISIPAMEIWPCVEQVLHEIADLAKEFVCLAGLDGMEEALSHPVYLSGGLASCFGMTEILTRDLHTPVYCDENPEEGWIRQYLS